MISSEIYVFRIQNDRGPEFSNINNIPALSGRDTRYISPRVRSKSLSAISMSILTISFWLFFARKVNDPSFTNFGYSAAAAEGEKKSLTDTCKKSEIGD